MRRYVEYLWEHERRGSIISLATFTLAAVLILAGAITAFFDQSLKIAPIVLYLGIFILFGSAFYFTLLNVLILKRIYARKDDQYT